MTLPPTSNTEQEIIIAEYLSELGFRYTQQEFFPPYKVDFYIEEINTAIEADGVYGHLSKRDKARDKVLMDKYNIDVVIHIKEKTKPTIQKALWQELNK